MKVKVKSLTKVEYVIQWFNSSNAWSDHDIIYASIKGAREERQTYKTSFPKHKFRIIKRTILERVVR